MKDVLQSPWFRSGKQDCRIDVMPGYDCTTECKHTSKGQHGIHGDEWRFIIRTESHALSLACYTCVLNGCYFRIPYGQKGHIEGAWLNLHDGRKPTGACDILVQGCSPAGDSAILAETIFDAFVHRVEPFLLDNVTKEKLVEIGQTKVEGLWLKMADVMYHWIGN